MDDEGRRLGTVALGTTVAACGGWLAVAAAMIERRRATERGFTVLVAFAVTASCAAVMLASEATALRAHQVRRERDQFDRNLASITR